MTGSLDVKMRAKATALISKLGKSISWFSDASPYSASTGKVSTLGTTYAVDAAVTSYDIALVDGSTIRSSDVQVTISAEDLLFTPKVGDSVVIDGVTLKVINASPLIGGSVIACEAQCRK